MKRFSSILALGIVLVIASGCDWFGFGLAKGSRAYYTIDGKVVDKSGNPVAGKEVVLAGICYDRPDVVDLAYNVWPFDTLYTDADGRYMSEGYSYYFEAVRVTTREYLDKISEGCQLPNSVYVVEGKPYMPVEWNGPYSEFPSPTFTGGKDRDDEFYYFWGYAAFEMPDLVLNQ